MDSGKFRILVVDDDRLDRLLARTILESKLYRVTECTTGRDAIEAVKNGNFDLVLLDIVMPDLNGIETCKELRSLRSAAQMPILFLSGKSDQLSVIRGLESGANDYILKPFHQEIFLARVEAHLRARTAAMQNGGRSEPLRTKAEEDRLIDALGRLLPEAPGTQRCDLACAVESLVTVLAALTSNRIEYHARLAPELPPARIRREEFQRIIFELLAHMVSAIDPAGEISVETGGSSSSAAEPAATNFLEVSLSALNANHQAVLPPGGSNFLHAAELARAAGGEIQFLERHGEKLVRLKLPACS